LATKNGADYCSDWGDRASAFHGWGGGVGIAMLHLNDRNTQYGDSNKALCRPGARTARPEVCPPADGQPGSEYAVSVRALDVSAYDGVSFWARRGPEGQDLLRVLVGDKHTDDDISYLTYKHDPKAPRYCERIRECACANKATCTYTNPAPCGLESFGSGFYCN